jgi:uncharacterized cupredoxin-like copper-binding protein
VNRGGPAIRICGAALALALAVIAFPAHRAEADPDTDSAAATATVDWSKAEVVAVKMTEYSFEPDHLSFRRGVPYRLHLQNTGSEIHDFSAPDFFRTISLRDTTALGSYGTSIVLKPGEQTNIDFVAPRPGTYELKCADHDWAGMTGMISVD